MGVGRAQRRRIVGDTDAVAVAGRVGMVALAVVGLLGVASTIQDHAAPAEGRAMAGPRAAPIGRPASGVRAEVTSTHHPVHGAGGGAPGASEVRVARLLDGAARRRCITGAAAARGPLLVVVGASFTAGVGPDTPTAAWSVDLARALGWRAVVLGVPGMGYSRVGWHHVGPLVNVVRLIDLGRLRPTLVVVQAGHDDWRVRPAAEERRVRAFYRALHRLLPRSRIAALTVFAGGKHPRPRLAATDRAIVAGVRAGDPTAIVLDPLARDWYFAREVALGLHPSAAGDRQIAELVVRALSSAGVRRSTQMSAAPICVLRVAGRLTVAAR
jgi:lysophospholipase L1-like esterase